MRSARVAGVAAAALLLGGAYVANTLLEGASEDRLAVEAERASRDAAVIARQAVATQAHRVSSLARDTLSSPGLVAALKARIGRSALGDLLATASWWDPYRSLAVAVSYQSHIVAFSQPGLHGVPFGQLITRVRARGEPVAAILAGASRAHLVSALAIPGPHDLPPAVLVLARAIDEQALSSLADAVGGAVMVVEGKRSLGAAGKDAPSLEKALRLDQIEPGDPSLAISSISLGSGLSLWVGARPRGAIGGPLAFRARKVLFWGAALLLSVPILLVTFRREGPRPVRGRPPLPSRRAATVEHPPAPSPAARAPARPRVPDKEATLGRYRLVDRIAEGSLAEVFTAVFQGAGGVHRSVVVKRLRSELAENPSAVAHFTDEAKLLSKLVHPNLVPVFDSGESNGTYFMAEEYVVGRDLGRLNERLLEARHPPLSVAVVSYVVHEILSGLVYIHGERPGLDAPAGFLHRDISPHNVMLSRLGEVKLIDFRIARAHQPLPPTDVGPVKGNADCLSPEQARGRAIDHRSDLFSVGLLLYRCAAGEPLYRGDTHYDRLARAAHGTGAQELERINALPAPLPALLTRALAIHPEARFQSAAEFRAAVAPHIAHGEDDVAGLLSDLFSDDLQLEIDRLMAATPGQAAAAARAADRRQG